MNEHMRNRCISTLKGIACILIVLIPCKFPGVIGELVVALARPAVFYFFMVSGYFVYAEDNNKFANKVRRQSYKVIKLTIVCFVVSFLWRILYAFIGDAWTIQDVIHSIFNKTSIFRMIVFQSDIVLGPFWFLLALVVCYFAVYLIRKAGLISICPYLIVIALLLNVYLAEIRNDVELFYYRNFWLTGFPFYMMGYTIHQFWNSIEVFFKQKSTVIGIIAGIVLTLVECLMLGHKVIYIGSIILIFFCFLYAIKNPSASITPLEFIGDKLSMYVYCCHWFVIEALGTVFAKIGVTGSNVFQYIYPLISVVCSLVLSFVIFKLTEQNSFLRKRV